MPWEGEGGAGEAVHLQNVSMLLSNPPNAHPSIRPFSCSCYIDAAVEQMRDERMVCRVMPLSQVSLPSARSPALPALLPLLLHLPDH